jgi:uncharacterized protein VirK/YbjX
MFRNEREGVDSRRKENKKKLRARYQKIWVKQSGLEFKPW